MQENVRFFDMKLHKNAYFSVCKVHKIAKISHFNRSKGLSKNSQTNIKKSAHGECKKSAKCLKSLKSLTKKKRQSDKATRKNYCSTKAININKNSSSVKGGK